MKTEVEYDIHPLIEKRWSPRSFLDKPIDEKLLMTLFKAAGRAPSSRNEQPWRFIYAHKSQTDAYNKLIETLKPGNKIWADKAPVLVVVLAHKTFSINNKPNRHAWHDTGIAIGNLLIQATAMGLHAHCMAGFEEDKARTLLNVPDEFDVVVVIAIGYKGPADQLPDKLRERELEPSERKELSKIVQQGEWKVKN